MRYTVHKNVQIIISLLKQYGISHIVFSAGTRHIPLAFSIENDPFFHCYSIVDERSAAFFALGLIEKSGEPVAIACTSGTATCNYVSAVNEAYYQQLPLVVLTSDRNPYYLNQQEEQMVTQYNLFSDAVKKSVNLPIVRDEKDAVYCTRLVNEALLELKHREAGPVHINFPIDDNYPEPMGTFKLKEMDLPKVRKIERISVESEDLIWDDLAYKLKHSRTMIIYGQDKPADNVRLEAMRLFAESFNCIYATDILSNVGGKYCIDMGTALKVVDLSGDLMPTLIITMNGASISGIKARFKDKGIEHWHISKEGMVSDVFRSQTAIIECSVEYFLKRLGSLADKQDNTYYEKWEKAIFAGQVHDSFDIEVEYSGTYLIQQFMKTIPKSSLLHLANSNSVRIASMFQVDPSIEVYCNRGTCGIDGSMSAFIGQAQVSLNQLCFLIIGDLSFFYDMNALWNRYIGANIRILLHNNFGGAIFHAPFYKQVEEFPNIDRHIAAGHDTQARAWAEARGFKYLSAHNKSEVCKELPVFMDSSEKQPILFEVFTEMETDAEQLVKLGGSMKANNVLKDQMGKLLSPSAKRKIKTLLKK